MDYIEQVLIQPNPITLGKFLSAQFNLSFYPWGLQKFCTKSIRYIVIALQWWVPVLDNPNICTSTSGFFFFFFFCLSAQSFAANTGALNFWKSLHSQSHLQPWCPDTAKSFPAPHLLLFLIIYIWALTETWFNPFPLFQQTDKQENYPRSLLQF